MEVEIVSREKIKPSSPTPQNLRILNLSLLDQIMSPTYIRTLLIYPAKAHYFDEVPERLQRLKKSLSETLTRFYPLAGKLRDDISIHCNDEGANFVEARVNSTLHEFLSHPDLSLLHKFFPCELVLTGSAAEACVTNVQVNMFECGGMAIGLCVSHKVGDYSWFSTFVKACTATTRGDFSVIPSFDASSLFPADPDMLGVRMWGCLLQKNNGLTRRFVFDGAAMARLRASSNTGYVPSRVEAVSALIWKCIMSAAQQRHRRKPRHSIMTHAVNLRRRMSPAVSDKCMGNFLLEVGVERRADESREVVELVRAIRECLCKVDAKKIQGIGSSAVMISEWVKGIGELACKDEVDYVVFSSWCRFGLYEADFGWGKPAWVTGNGSNAFKNVVVLVDTRSGDGIEAWLTMDEEEMMIMENDHHRRLLQYAALDPTPLTNM